MYNSHGEYCTVSWDLYLFGIVCNMYNTNFGIANDTCMGPGMIGKATHESELTIV